RTDRKNCSIRRQPVLAQGGVVSSCRHRRAAGAIDDDASMRTIRKARTSLGRQNAMSWLDGFTKNWANLAEENEEPGLRAVVVPLPPAEAVSWAASLIVPLRRWAVVTMDPEAGTLHATHMTILWRFVDDVRLQFRTDGAGGTIITGRSRSRIG